MTVAAVHKLLKENIKLKGTKELRARIQCCDSQSLDIFLGEKKYRKHLKFNYGPVYKLKAASLRLTLSNTRRKCSGGVRGLYELLLVKGALLKSFPAGPS